MQQPLAFLDFLGPSEMIIVGIVAILLFGERLPEVARTWGKHFMEFKKSVQGIRQEFESAAGSLTSTVEQSIYKAETESHEEVTAPKFVPPPSEPPSGASGQN